MIWSLRTLGAEFGGALPASQAELIPVLHGLLGEQLAVWASLLCVVIGSIGHPLHHVATFLVRTPDEGGIGLDEFLHADLGVVLVFGSSEELLEDPISPQLTTISHLEVSRSEWGVA